MDKSRSSRCSSRSMYRRLDTGYCYTRWYLTTQTRVTLTLVGTTQTRVTVTLVGTTQTRVTVTLVATTQTRVTVTLVGTCLKVVSDTVHMSSCKDV